MRRWTAVVGVLVAIGLAGPGGRQACAADGVARIALPDAAVASARTLVGRLQSIGTFRHEELLRLSTRSGLLEIEIGPAARRVGQFRCRTDISDADWVISYSEYAPPNRPVTQSLVLNRYDFAQIEAGGIWSTTVHVRPANITIDARAGTGAQTGRVHLVSSAGVLRVSVTGRKFFPDGRALHLPGNNLDDLRMRWPREFRQYVIPVFEGLCGRDPFAAQAGDVYRTYTDLPADADAIRQVRQLLPELDAPMPADREAASRKLDVLGPAGVLAALRLERTALSPEQSGRLDRFIARYEDRRFANAHEARNNVWFLIDCLEFDDPAVRKRAATDLSELLGRPVGLDEAAAVEKWGELADALRVVASKTPIRSSTRPTASAPGHAGAFVPQPVASE